MEDINTILGLLQGSKNALPIEDAKKYIDDLDLNMIIKKMVSQQGWSQPDAECAIRLYKNFLLLKCKYGTQFILPPNKEIDEVWHNHILSTHTYSSQMNELLGEDLHHYPYAGIDGVITPVMLKKYYNKTQQLHYTEFGYYIWKIRLSWHEIVIEIMKMMIKKTFKQQKNKLQASSLELAK